MNQCINCSLPEDVVKDETIFNKTKTEIINTLSEKQFSISQTRYLFHCILSQFERDMPVSNHVK